MLLHSRRTAAAAAITGTMLVLAACAADAPAPVQTLDKVQSMDKPAAATSSQPQAPAKPAFTFPLTGLPADKPVKQRPVAVMVENSPQSRPQSGLHQADLVYEVLAEGEITRFIALYQSKQAERIGPVRSIRPYMIELGDGHDALLVHAGWSPDAKEVLVNRKLNHFDQVYGDDTYYWRDNSRRAPHNLYTSIAHIMKGAADKKYRTDWKGSDLAFAETPAALPASAQPAAGQPAAGQPAAGPAGQSAGQPASSLRADYIRGYYVEYRYNESTRSYDRYMEGAAHKDKESGAQLSAVNLIVIEAEHRTLDNEGRREVTLTRPGKGYYAVNGTLMPVDWERRSGILQLSAGGKTVKLAPGTTWVQIVPIGSKVEWR